MLDYEHARANMVDVQIAGRGLRNASVLDAMRAIPREKFVGEGFEDRAYEDSPLPIGHGQTISQPFIVAYMIEAARLEPGSRVLEVGTGSGYAAAVMAKVAREVFTIERHAILGEAARRTLAALGFNDVVLRVGDGSNGWPDNAPFDAIIVAAASPTAPASLKTQLVIGGRLIIPIGEDQQSQRLVRVTRRSSESFEEEDLGGVSFVPLIGDQGWDEKLGRPSGQLQSRS